MNLVVHGLAEPDRLRDLGQPYWDVLRIEAAYWLKHQPPRVSDRGKSAAWQMALFGQVPERLQARFDQCVAFVEGGSPNRREERMTEWKEKHEPPEYRDALGVIELWAEAGKVDVTGLREGGPVREIIPDFKFPTIEISPLLGNAKTGFGIPPHETWTHLLWRTSKLLSLIAPAPISTVAAREACRKFIQQRKENGLQPNSKRALFNEAEQSIKNLTWKTYLRVWKDEAPEAWKRHGKKSIPRIDTPISAD